MFFEQYKPMYLNNQKMHVLRAVQQQKLFYITRGVKIHFSKHLFSRPKP
jgi:hypothetical protein